MAVISVLRNNGKEITKARNSTLSNIKLDSVDYHFAKENEVNDGICENAVNEPIIDMQISGNSVQKTYTGKNLIPRNLFTSSTKNGITLNVNDDGTITVIEHLKEDTLEHQLEDILRDYEGRTNLNISISTEREI